MRSDDGKAIGQVSQVGRVAPGYGATDPRQQAFLRALAPLLGKAMHGEVMTRLSDGSFVVKLADIPVRMQLPAGAKAGADVPLTLVALNPRPTFQVGTAAQPVFSEAEPPPPRDADPGKVPLAMREGSAAQNSLAVGRAAALVQANAAASATGSPNLDSTTTILSRTGKVIGGVLAAARQADAPLTAVPGRTPVMAAAGMDAPAIAAGLRQAVGESGLFYESHLAEWAQGKRTLAELDAEPQQQLAREGVRQSPLDPSTAQFINLQLATQEQACLAWEGKLWPGQAMQLEVQRDTQAGHDADGEPETAWHSRLLLRFPGLGELDTRLTLAGGSVQVRFDTDDHATAALLRRHMASLADALEATGTRLTGFEARRSDDDC